MHMSLPHGATYRHNCLASKIWEYWTAYDSVCVIACLLSSQTTPASSLWVQPWLPQPLKSQWSKASSLPRHSMLSIKIGTLLSAEPNRAPVTEHSASSYPSILRNVQCHEDTHQNRDLNKCIMKLLQHFYTDLQATRASLKDQKSSQIVPHVPLYKTSTLPMWLP